MFTIGEFSKITGLSIKTLRHYHEKGVLAPPLVDEASGYRYYNHQSIERARIITQLRAMDFGLAEIAEILGRGEDQAEILEILERHMRGMEERVRHQQEIVSALKQIVTTEREAMRVMEKSAHEVMEKDLAPLAMAGVRMRGKYSDCGKGFARLGRALGRFAGGKPFCLYYDGEYREDDADFETCLPVKAGARAAEGISLRELPGGPCVALIHQGPYEELGRSYEKLFHYLHAKGYKPRVPSREVYLKGPGMIFKGNPKNYLTEIQVLVEK